MGGVLGRGVPVLAALALLTGCSPSGGTGPGDASSTGPAGGSRRPPAGQYLAVGDLCAVTDFQPVYASLPPQTTPFPSSTPGSGFTTLQCSVTVGPTPAPDETAGLEVLVTIMDKNVSGQGAYQSLVAQFRPDSTSPRDDLGQEAVTVVDDDQDQFVLGYDGNAAIEVSLVPTGGHLHVPPHIFDRLVEVARNVWAKLRAS
jgi:hypothetical protein